MTKPSSKPALLALAAGMGSRYGGLKQIEPVGPHGETILDYSVFDALRAGFGQLVFVIRRDTHHAFRQAIGARFEPRLPVQYVFQELDALPAGFAPPPGRAKPWGTGHAILMAQTAIQTPFAAINADDFYGANSFRLLAAHLQSGSDDYAMVGYTLRNTLSEFGAVSRGVCHAGPDGLVTAVTEWTKLEPDGPGARQIDPATGAVRHLTGDEPVSMNLWGFPEKIFPQLRERFEIFLREKGRDDKSEFYIPAAVNELVAAGAARLRLLRTPDSWFGITYRDDRPRVIQSLRQLTARGDYPSPLWPD